MRSIIASSLLTLLNASTALALWNQCGGLAWTGSTTCEVGAACVYLNYWYSQCLPAAITSTGNPTSTTKTTSKQGTTAVQTTAKTSSTRTTSTAKTTTTKAAGTGTGTSPPGTTLLPGLYWIRAVTTPHFHEYLQSPAGTAIIASHLTAGQFAIVSGQLVQTTSTGKLYANVEQRSDAADMLLGVKFTSSPNTFGTFNWSGDALQWTVSSITRPNPSAWYVCGSGNILYINLGQYLYGTPTGCTDHTIHFYNGATADV